MTTSDVAPELGDALQALLILGNACPATFQTGTESELTQFISSEIATTERLGALRVATDAPAKKGGSGSESASASRPSLPAALVLLADVSVRNALASRYRKDFEYVALQHNQFLLIRDEHRTELHEIYEAFLEDLMELLDAPGVSTEEGAIAALQEAMVDHHVALWQFAQSLLRGQFMTGTDLPAAGVGSADASSGVAFAPPNYEYDPEFQLSLWGLTPDTLRGKLTEPILDLGCGEQASLVRYLRAAGLEAYGIDKFADEDEFVTRGDWLDVPLEQGQWGTIISHMGFSNHFFHHHLRKDGHPERYARRFMEILGAIKPGGRFLYAPGLPFFESLLPESRVEIATHPIDVGPDVAGFLGAMDDAVKQAQAVAGRNGASGATGAAPDRRPALYATEIRIRGEK